jgi:putative phosphoribosyl transferase
MTDAPLPYDNRRQAGRVLAGKLAHYAGRPHLLVLALPRGGVPVAHEVALALDAPLNICVVRKLGFPGQEEYALGALASGGVRVMNPLPGVSVSPEALAGVVAREQAELVRREILYRGPHPAPELRGRTVIVVDDGLATGATMRAALLAIRQQRSGLQDAADEVVCAATPEPFHAVGLWYRDFGQTSDEEVRALLDEARRLRTRAIRAHSQPARL